MEELLHYRNSLQLSIIFISSVECEDGPHSTLNPTNTSSTANIRNLNVKSKEILINLYNMKC